MSEPSGDGFDAGVDLAFVQGRNDVGGGQNRNLDPARCIDEVQSCGRDGAWTQTHDEARLQRKCIFALVGTLMGQQLLGR